MLPVLSHADVGEPNQTLFIEPVSMWIISGVGDMDVISLGYEKRLGAGPWSVLGQLHGGYNRNGRPDEDFYSKDYAVGTGLGIRRYIGALFDGAYLTGQVDYVRGESWDMEYFGFTETTNPYGLVHRNRSLFMGQFSCGYKFAWKFFVLDLAVGGALYRTPDEIYTYPILGGNLGLPFNASFFSSNGKP